MCMLKEAAMLGLQKKIAAKLPYWILARPHNRQGTLSGPEGHSTEK